MGLTMLLLVPGYRRWAAKSPITANLGTAMQRQDIHILLLIQIISITAVPKKLPSVTVNSILP